MLRSQLGDDLYRRCIKTYLERHQFGNVTTEDLNQVVEELSGRSFDQFFNQYVYHAHHPELTVSYSWDERARLVKLSIQQVQKLSEDVLLFNVPLPVRFKLKSGTVERTVLVKEKVEDFYVPLSEAPEVIRIDPNVTLLAKVNFTPPTAMLYAQLADPEDAIGRVQAVEQLSGRKEALSKLKDALNNDPFYAVRLAAAQSLRAMMTDEALEALLASTKQSDARVRRQVVADIAGFYRETSYDAAMRISKEEKNPDIQAVALTSLGAYAKPDVREKLVEFLNSTSYRSSLADAAIRGIRAQDEAGYVAPLLEALQRKEALLTTGVFSRGMEALGWLARNEEKKDAVREFLLPQLNSDRKRLQLSAIGALSLLGDPKAIPALEKFTTAPKQSPERAAAERAVNTLRDTRKSSAEVSALRNEVLGLQRENRELRKDLDEVKKKLDAFAARPEGAKAAKGSPASKPKK